MYRCDNLEGGESDQGDRRMWGMFTNFYSAFSIKIILGDPPLNVFIQALHVLG